MIDALWVEKYRPQKLADIVGQQHAIERLQAWTKIGSIPHLLLAGPAGSGKSSASLALARELFGAHWRENFRETNASDDRGIDVVRTKIKEFARTRPIAAPFKIQFLDEADALTPEAQQALRRTMEQFSGTTRFILAANYSSKLIEPIQSRCAVFRFRSLDPAEILPALERIAKAEKLKSEPAGLKAIAELAEGDLRRAINLLQATAATDGITADAVYETAARAKPNEVKALLETALAGDFPAARKALHQLLYVQGLAGQDLLRDIHRALFDLDLPEPAKVALLQAAGETEFRLTQGGSDDLQLEAFLAQLLALRR